MKTSISTEQKKISWKKSRGLRMLIMLLFGFSISQVLAQTQTLDSRISEIIAQMTLEEKIKQLHQQGSFNTADNTRLGIPGFFMADGPHGVRDGLATSFPVSIAMAATWDPGLVQRIGEAMGKEFRAKGKHQALGPCIDLCRDPRNGRSPESSGEDPYLSAQITTALVKGIQSTPVIATIKHFNCVNRQNNRHSSNVIISQRMLMEHYGLNFRTAVQQGGAMSVMNAYNLINGQKCAENTNLLTTVLREKWGFPYYVVSDWGSIWNSEAAIKAGCNICMGSDKYENDLLNHVTSGAVSEATIDEAVRRVLRTKIMAGMLDYYPKPDPNDLNSEAHQKLALEAGRKSIVLLKNEDNILPLDKNKVTKVALIGPSAAVAQLDGTGSSYVTPFYSVSPREGIENKIGTSKVLYAKGCDINGTNTSGFSEAKAMAAQAEVVIFIGGLDTEQEGEGRDRVGGSIQLPGKQQDLINKLASVNSNLIVVLKSGGICGLARCITNIKGLLYAFYPGQEGGNAIADVLFGDRNPGGKLPVTMPKTDSQLPAWNNDFTDDHGCGYRWFDQQGITPQFSFGHGLSYTTFSYSNLAVSPSIAPIGQEIEVSVDVTNTGSRHGEEVIQLYLIDDAASVPMPVKQLKGFKRVALDSGETKTVKLSLTADEFYFYNETTDRFEVEPGTFTVKVGGGADNLPLTGGFELTASPLKPDLIITSIKMVPPHPIRGDEVIFLSMIKNQGTGASPAGTPHEVVFKVNGDEISWSDEFDASIPAGSMALLCANKGFAGSNSWTADELGTFTIEALLDSDNRIDECIEVNNRKTTTVTVIPPPPINVALHRRVIVTSFERSGLEGDKAVDGNYGTRWSSAFSDQQFMIIDLDTTKQIDHVLLHWETAYGKEYEIQVSDNLQDWKTIEHVVDGDGGVDQIAVGAAGRYVRMYGIKRGTQWGYSLYEFEVYLSDTTSTGVNQNETGSLLPRDYALGDNYPNPFNPVTTIRYDLPERSQVTLMIYDILGREIRRLVNTTQDAGYKSVTWDGTNDLGEQASTGVYLYRIEAGDFTQTRKMLLLR